MEELLIKRIDWIDSFLLYYYVGEEIDLGLIVVSLFGGDW